MRPSPCQNDSRVHRPVAPWDGTLVCAPCRFQVLNADTNHSIRWCALVVPAIIEGPRLQTLDDPTWTGCDPLRFVFLIRVTRGKESIHRHQMPQPVCRGGILKGSRFRTGVPACPFLRLVSVHTILVPPPLVGGGKWTGSKVTRWGASFVCVCCNHIKVLTDRLHNSPPTVPQASWREPRLLSPGIFSS